MKAHFKCGLGRAAIDFKDDATAIAFAHRVAQKMCFWGFEAGSFLQLTDEDGDVIAEIRLTRPFH